jgi:hypothetical protein
MDAIQYLRRIESNEMDVGLMVLLVRNMLKLGLSYEKRKTFDSAYLTFAELTSLLIKYRDIDLNKLGLEERDTGTKKLIEFNNDSVRLVRAEDKKILNYYKEIRPRLYPDYYNHELFFEKIDDKSFLKILTKRITPIKEKILIKISTFEGIRLIYQPLLAKLQIIEKSHLGGITEVDIFRLKQEFTYLQRVIDVKEKYLMACEFNNKAGDILYYKNGYVQKNSKENEYKNKNFCKYKDNKGYNSKYCNDSCSACEFYISGINKFMESNFPSSTGNPLLILLDKIC